MKKALINPLTFLALLHDIAVAVVAWVVAYLLRFNFSIPENHMQFMMQSILWVVPLQSVVFIFLSLYRGTWRFASVPDLKRILFAWIVCFYFFIILSFMQAAKIYRTYVFLYGGI